MATPRGLTQFAFATGIDEAQQAEVLDPMAGFTRLENVRQDKRGGLSKRLGTAALDTTTMDGTSIASGRAVVPLGKTVSCVDASGDLRTWSPNAARWVDQNRAPECLPTRIPMPYPGKYPGAADVAYANGYIIAVSWSLDYTTTLTYKLVATVYDETEGVVVRVDEFPADLDSAILRLVTVGSVAVLVYMNTATVGATEFAIRTLSLASAATIAAGWSGEDISGFGDVAADAVGKLDVCATVTGQFAVAYRGTVNTVKVARFTLSGTTAAAAEQVSVAAAATAVAVAYDGASALWLSYAVGTAVSLRQYSASSLASVTGTTVALIVAGASVTRLGIASLSSTSCRVLASTTTTGTSHTYVRSGAVSAGACVTSGATRTAFRLYAASKPWIYNSRVLVVMVQADNATSENQDKMAFVCDQTADTGTTRALAVLAARQVVAVPSSYLGNVVALATGRYAATLFTERSATGMAFELAHLDFNDTRRWRSSEFAECAYMAGGVVSFFDGSRVDEAGFLVRPDPPVATVTAVAGNPALTAVKYIAIYEKTDSNGNIHWSAPSDPSNAVSPASFRVNVVCTTLQLTQHHDATDTSNPARIVLFRSGANGALPYQRVVDDETGISSGTVADVLNDYAASTVTLVDNQATVTSNQSLYRQPGLNGTEQAHQCPPACSLLIPYNGSLVGLADDGVTLFYSAYRIPGEGVWWSDVFQLPIAEEGQVAALAVLDGTLVVFKRSAIFAVAGVAPSGDGAQGGFGDYRRIASDVGCVEPRSVVSTSLGVFFQSERGIEILSRAQSAEWIGEGVQDTLASYPVITAATLDAKANLVRFECVASETAGVASDTGVTLVYDLSLRLWVSVDKVYLTNASRSAQAATVAYLDGSYRYMRLDKAGVLSYETPAAHLDGSQWVTMLAETAWLKLGGIQGKHMVNKLQWLSRASTRADYSMELAYDYAGTYKTASTRAANDVDTLSAAIGRVQFEHTLHDECEGVALRVLLSDATPTGGTVSTGKGATWIALTFEGTPRDGATALPDTSR